MGPSPLALKIFCRHNLCMDQNGGEVQSLHPLKALCTLSQSFTVDEEME